MKPQDEISTKKEHLNQVINQVNTLDDNKFYGECDLFEIIPELRNRILNSRIDFKPIMFCNR